MNPNFNQNLLDQPVGCDTEGQREQEQRSRERRTKPAWTRAWWLTGEPVKFTKTLRASPPRERHMTEIVSTPDTLGDAPRIEGRRIGIHHIAKWVLDTGVAPAQVAADYDLDLADVYRALTYYYNHSDEMRAVRKQRQSILEGMDIVEIPGNLDRRDGVEKEA